MVTFKLGGTSFLGPGQSSSNSSERRFGTAHDLCRAQYGPVFTRTDRGSPIHKWTPASGIPGLFRAGRPASAAPAQRFWTHLDRRSPRAFSEIKTGLHMGIVTATDNRADIREIYIQPDEHAMAHYSYASPDRKSVLVVEMSGEHAFTQPRRLVPFDGSSVGRQVGPQGTCLSAAWSPDGRWMYFGAVVEGNSHLWRQRFPDGAPEQITFGPLEEEGIALAPDGRSIVTSVGMRRSAVWIHDTAGERALVSEGYASAPSFSRDGTRVFYLFARDWWLAASGWLAASADLRSVNFATGKSDVGPSGQSVTAYAISRDEKDVAFTTPRRQWSIADLAGAPLLGHTPSPNRQRRRSGVVRCSWRIDLPVPGGEQRAGPDQDGRNRPGANTDGVRPGEGRRVTRRRVGDHPRTWDWQGCCPRHARRPHPWRCSQDHLLHMLSNVVYRREVLLCREQPERFPDLRWKDARDSCAGGQVVAGSARCGNQRCRWSRWTAGRRDD